MISNFPSMLDQIFLKTPFADLLLFNLFAVV